MEFNNRDTATEATLRNWQPPAPRAGFEDRIFDAATGARTAVRRTLLVGKIAAGITLILGAALLAVYNQPATTPHMVEAPKPAAIKQVAKKQIPNLMAELPPVSPVPESLATDGLLPSVNIYTALEASAVLTLPDALKTPEQNTPISPLEAAAEATPTP